VGDVLEFRRKFGLNYLGRPRALPDDGSKHAQHMQEELDEFNLHHTALILAIQAGDQEKIQEHLAECLDALIDLQYVALGTAEKMGFLTPSEATRGIASLYEAGWSEVHGANMEKELAGTPERSTRGDPNDVIKPDGWQPPDHRPLVAANAYSGAAK
jgi:predicted HAD superfamily Cof-like phosphohydrolase